MTQKEIQASRKALVKTLVAIKELNTKKASLIKSLTPDIDENELEYRNGIKTEDGLLFLKLRRDFEVKPVVVIEGMWVVSEMKDERWKE